MKTYSVAPEEKGHSFVKGNTKYLKDMSQEELKTLSENGDPRVKLDEKPAEDKKSARPAIPATTV